MYPTKKPNLMTRQQIADSRTQLTMKSLAWLVLIKVQYRVKLYSEPG